MNCAAIPEHLLESEMFGHETGAFTGASKRRIGRFELAHGGDIFLDEISTMKTMLQVKLLRVLQDKEFCRLGSCSPIYSDCRVISASNQPLDHLIETGSFRLDLYHRLCVIQLVVPPLRERSDDIPLLVEHFIDKFTEPSRRKRFSENAMSRLMEYSWPGNVRELANVVQSLSIMVRGDTICDTSFPAWMMSIRSKNGASAPYVNSSCGLPPDIDGQVFLLKEYVANAERRHIEHALQFHNFEKSKTAAALGISRTTLYLKMREMGVVG
jgi:two-component system response regulator AtoC